MADSYPTFIRAQGILHVFWDQDVQQLLPASRQAGVWIHLGLQLRLWGRWGGWGGFPGGELLLCKLKAPITLKACWAGNSKSACKG